MYTTFNCDLDYILNCGRLGIRPNPSDYAAYLKSIAEEIEDELWDQQFKQEH